MSMFSSITTEDNMEKLQRFIQKYRDENLSDAEILQKLEHEIEETRKSAKAGYE